MTFVAYSRKLAHRPLAWAGLLAVLVLLLALPGICSRMDPHAPQSGLRAWQLLGTGGMSSESDFSAGEATAILGRYTLDLTKAVMRENGAVIRANAVFGLVEVKVPKDWEVSVQGLPILGGYRDKTGHGGSGAEHLLVSGLAVFGAVRVTN